MRRVVVLLLAIVFLLVPAFCQKGGARPNMERPSREEVLKLMDLMHARAQFEQVIAQMTKELQAGARSIYQKSHPTATPGQLIQLDSAFNQLQPLMTVDDLLNDVVPLYQKYLTKRELAAAIEFYSSQAGQSFFSKMPKIQEEGMQRSNDRNDQRVDAYLGRLRECIKKFDAGENPASDDAPPAKQ